MVFEFRWTHTAEPNPGGGRGTHTSPVAQPAPCLEDSQKSTPPVHVGAGKESIAFGVQLPGALSDTVPLTPEHIPSMQPAHASLIVDTAIVHAELSKSSALGVQVPPLDGEHAQEQAPARLNCSPV